MENNYTNSTIESTILVPRRAAAETRYHVEQSDRSNVTRKDLIITPVASALPHITEAQPIVVHSVHPSISEFVRRVAEIEGVHCVVAEDISEEDKPDEYIIHLTTFAHPLSEQTRSAVYAIEAELIDEYPDRSFDFHLRDSSGTVTQTPMLLPGQRFFAIWGTLNEESGRSSDASEKQ